MPLMNVWKCVRRGESKRFFRKFGIALREAAGTLGASTLVLSTSNISHIKALSLFLYGAL